MKLSRRRFERKYPAPPPTPPGMVYAKKFGELVLVPAEDLARFCQKGMQQFDELPPHVRAALRDGKYDNF